MTTPLVSIILPFLNGGPAFEPALASLLGQTYQNWELLLCDDGSRDGSLELAQSIQDSRVTVWSDGKSKGLAARLNECIERAKGDWIARMDADDVAYPERIERQVAFLKSHPDVDVVGCPMLIFGEDGQVLGRRAVPIDHAGIVANPALGFGLAHPTWMARAAWYRAYRYNPAALRYEDAELLHRSYRTSHFANLSQILYAYREPRGGLRKRFKTRVGRVRFLRSQNDAAVLARAAAAESFKAASDAILTVLDARYQMLRRREQPVTATELAEWQAVMRTASLRPFNEMKVAREVGA